MNFEDDFEKAITNFGEPVKIFTNSKETKGFALFKSLAKNNEDFTEETQDEVGIINCSKYSIWLYTKENLKHIDYILFHNTKYIPLNQKYNYETGCLELVTFKN